MNDEYILEMQDIVKTFPGVKALKNAQLKVRPGTVHTLMGENGAGKSTLMKCLMGIYHANSGTILFEGRQVDFKTTLQAMQAGITMIPQEMSPVLERSVCENVWIGREPMKGPFIDHKKMHDGCVELFRRLNLPLDPKAKMKDLTVAKMQMVEIAKAVSHNAKIVIMDEPTSALTQSETEDLFRIIDDLKAQNVAIIYISHKMDEIFRISDEITIFRDGEFIYSDLAKNLDMDKVIHYMVGREVKDMFPKTPCEIGDVILRVENLSAGKAVKNVSFELHRGEILGFAGLVGAGRSEAMEAIFGIRKKTGGKIYKDGRELNIKAPADAIENGIALLTEDRRATGIIGLLDIEDNITIANWKSYGFPMNHRQMKRDALEYIRKINIKTPSERTKIRDLSGGNQQKALLARWMLVGPDILIVDEPTRGIDVGAKSEIHNLISKMVREGKAVIMVSSEMAEVIGVSDRIIVMHEGEMTATLERSEATQDVIMRYATGEAQEAAPEKIDEGANLR